MNYKYRMHDPRLGRFFAVDPLTASYPHYTPYSFSGNQVINAVELEGLEPDVLSETETATPPGGLSEQGTAAVTVPVSGTATPNPVSSSTGDEQSHWGEGDQVTVNNQSLTYHCGVTCEDGSQYGDGWYKSKSYNNWKFGQQYRMGWSPNQIREGSAYSWGDYSAVMERDMPPLYKPVYRAPEGGGIRMVAGPEALLGPGMFKVGGNIISGLWRNLTWKYLDDAALIGASYGDDLIKYTTNKTLYSKFTGASDGRIFYGIKNYSKDATKLLNYAKGNYTPKLGLPNIGGSLNPWTSRTMKGIMEYGVMGSGIAGSVYGVYKTITKPEEIKDKTGGWNP